MCWLLFRIWNHYCSFVPIFDHSCQALAHFGRTFAYICPFCQYCQKMIRRPNIVYTHKGQEHGQYIFLGYNFRKKFATTFWRSQDVKTLGLNFALVVLSLEFVRIQKTITTISPELYHLLRIFGTPPNWLFGNTGQKFCRKTILISKIFKFRRLYKTRSLLKIIKFYLKSIKIKRKIRFVCGYQMFLHTTFCVI